MRWKAFFESEFESSKNQEPVKTQYNSKLFQIETLQSLEAMRPADLPEGPVALSSLMKLIDAHRRRLMSAILIHSLFVERSRSETPSSTSPVPHPLESESEQTQNVI